MRIGLSLDYSSRLVGLLNTPPGGEVSALSRMVLSRVAEESLGLGFRHLEIPMDPLMMMPWIAGREEWERLDRMRSREGVSFTVHLPFRDIRLASLHEEVRRAGVEAVRRALRLSSPLKSEAYVLHLASEMEEVLLQPYLPSRVRRRASSILLQAARRSLEELLPHLPSSRQLLIENLEVMPPRELWTLAEEFDTGVCLDVGHAALQFANPSSYVEEYANRLGEIHLHDVARLKLSGGLAILRDHMAVGSGQLDVEEILQALNRVNFQGPVVLEVNQERAKQSLEALRRMVTPTLTAGTATAGNPKR